METIQVHCKECGELFPMTGEEPPDADGPLERFEDVVGRCPHCGEEATYTAADIARERD